MKNHYYGAGILFWYPDPNSGDTLILLGKRAFGFERRKWSIPGGGWDKKDGYVDGKKDLEKTALREAKEEVYFDVREKRFLKKIWSIRSILFNWDTFSVKCRSKIFVKKFEKEFSKMRWFSVNDLPKNRSVFIDRQVENLLTLIKAARRN